MDPSRIGEIDLGPVAGAVPPAPELQAVPVVPGSPEVVAVEPRAASAAPAAVLTAELTPAELNDFFTSLDKAVRARRLYASNNPAYLAFLGTVKEKCRRLWDGAYSLSCVVDENGFNWEGQTFAAGEGRENLAFQFYKDGIRLLTFTPGFEDELERFMDVLARARQVDQTSADDMVTLLWEQEFQSLQYSYVDALAEGIEVPATGHISFEKIELTLVAEDSIAPVSTDPNTRPHSAEQNLPPVAQTITRDDFAETLYFLEPAELEYLNREVEKEMARDIKGDVLSALFDRLEDPVPKRQTEILRIVRQLLPAYLSSGDLHSASTILIELNNILSMIEILGETQKREAQEIFSELSEPAVLNQLLKSLEDGAIDPSGEELAIFLRYLRPEALAPLIRATETTRVPALQQRLRGAIEGLAREHPEILTELFKHGDEIVNIGAARLAGQIGLAAAVAAIGSLLKSSSIPVRKAAAEALVQIKSGAALDALQNALEDPEREVRIAAARGIGGLRYQPARARLEAILQGKIVRDADLTEKIAFFEAFGSVANADSVELLDRMLNGKKLLGGRESPELRACAAMALGKVGSPASKASLQRAMQDKEAMVRNAVMKALRQEVSA
ncbi:MAG: HEAT repeat domain-containing protein [Gemmatimonadota bacterium]